MARAKTSATAKAVEQELALVPVESVRAGAQQQEESRTAGYSGVQIFSATKSYDRGTLGERVTDWIRQNTDKKVIRAEVRQSSDREYHCLSFVIFFASAAQ